MCQNISGVRNLVDHNWLFSIVIFSIVIFSIVIFSIVIFSIVIFSIVIFSQDMLMQVISFNIHLITFYIIQ